MSLNNITIINELEEQVDILIHSDEDDGYEIRYPIQPGVERTILVYAGFKIERTNKELKIGFKNDFNLKIKNDHLELQDLMSNKIKIINW